MCKAHLIKFVIWFNIDSPIHLCEFCSCLEWLKHKVFFFCEICLDTTLSNLRIEGKKLKSSIASTHNMSNCSTNRPITECWLLFLVKAYWVYTISQTSSLFFFCKIHMLGSTRHYWGASKMKREKYGERTILQVDQKVEYLEIYR